MTEARITANVRHISPKTSIIDIQGDVNVAAEKPLTDAFADASNGETKVVALNFSGLEYMNSSGIGFLVTLLIRAQRQQQRLIAFGLSEHYQQIFELTRLNEAILLYPDEAAALVASQETRSER
jgi:anti-sigma B factor antagonist